MDNLQDAAIRAAELVPCALLTLDQLMRADGQPGPVRVAAAKAVIDYALKLNDKQGAHSDTLAKLDLLLDEYRRGYQYEPLHFESL